MGLGIREGTSIVRARPMAAVCAAVLLVTGAALLGGSAYMRAKSLLAALLIDRAWAAHLADGRAHRPWGWADLHPLARLTVRRTGVTRVVLDGASGTTLAFGLGHVSGTALPNEPGNCALAGHRDTWSAFLKDLRVGDEVRLQTRDEIRSYRVREIEVVSRDAVDVLEPTARSRLTLITCYPFGGLVRSPWRYVVICETLSNVRIRPSRENDLGLNVGGRGSYFLPSCNQPETHTPSTATSTPISPPCMLLTL